MLSVSLGWMSQVVLSLAASVLVAGAAHADEAEYTVLAKPLTLKVGQQAPLEVRFAPKAPWHWNQAYPAKLMLVADGVTIARAELKQKELASESDFKVAADAIDAAFQLTATKAGATTGTLKGKIGLCDDKVCIVKKVELTVALTATR